ncbi:MAG TPA: hypothetical protein GX393_07050 [Firmicutes bacterium]|jgi:hypothetical protein|nr:hypothetical protein [Bacillota bacterium]
MKQFGGAFAILLAVVFCAAGTVHAFVFTDPAGLYSTQIADSWVYQAHHSTEHLVVFYGDEDSALLYFERLGTVSYLSAWEFAHRSLELYRSPGGLEKFEMVRDLAEVEVGGEAGVSCAYTYQDGQGNQLWEYRVFLVLPGGEGFSIAFSDSRPEAADDPRQLEEILLHWRWLF